MSSVFSLQRETRAHRGTTLADRSHVPLAAIAPTIPLAPRAAREVPAHKTPTEPESFRAALASAYRGVTGRAPSRATLDVLTAHVAHETARGDRMYNYNFGGIKGASPDGFTARYQTREVLGSREVRLVDGFRAYRTLDEGASDYLATLQRRFGGAFERAEEGDVSGFASELKRSGYYTAPVEDYTRALQSLVRDGVDSLRGPSAIAQTRGGGRFLYGTELTDEGARLDARSALPTTIEVMRVLDAVGSMTARIGEPTDTSDSEESR